MLRLTLMVCVYNIDTWPLENAGYVRKIQIISPNVVFYIIASYAQPRFFLVLGLK